MINLTPSPVKEWAIQTFGTSDKTFLTVMVVVVISALIAVAAIWERARIPLGTAVLVAAGVAGSVAVLNQPGGTVVDLVPTILGTADADAACAADRSAADRSGGAEPGSPPFTADPGTAGIRCDQRGRRHRLDPQPTFGRR